MGRTWRGLVLAAAVVCGLAGCHKADYLQPPKPKDEFVPPPTDDPRFSNPPNYPAKLLNQDNMRKQDDEDDAPGRGGGHRGQGPAGSPYDH
jgi:hypothetical protein